MLILLNNGFTVFNVYISTNYSNSVIYWKSNNEVFGQVDEMIHRDKELWDSTFASEKRQIPFSDLKELFDPQYWDVGVITEDELLQVALMPIKSEMHQFGCE